MHLSLSDITTIARAFVATLDDGHIEKIADLEVRMGATYEISHQKKDALMIERRPSNFGTSAYTLSYIRENGGIPLEVRLNQDLSYTQIILKCEEDLAGYAPFAVDPSQNIVQTKKFDRADVGLVKAELKRLSHLGP